MTAHIAAVGRIAPRSQAPAMYVNGARVEPTREPLAVTPVTPCDSEPVPCPWCGERYGCDCQDWIEWMAQAQPAQEDDDVA